MAFVIYILYFLSLFQKFGVLHSKLFLFVAKLISCY